jgi:hypothetical protein
MKSTPTSFAFLIESSNKLGLSVIKGITGIRNIPQAIPSFLNNLIVSRRSDGLGTPGSKIQLTLSFTDEKLKLTIALLRLFIFLRISRSLFTRVDFVRI